MQGAELDPSWLAARLQAARQGRSFWREVVRTVPPYRESAVRDRLCKTWPSISMLPGLAGCRQWRDR